MKRTVSFLLLAALLLSSLSLTVSAETETLTEETVYSRMIVLKDEYYEGYPCSDDDYYEWNGGIYAGGSGSEAFAFFLSDKAFGTLPARKYTVIDYDALRVGDILRFDSDNHSVVILKKFINRVEVAEGNYHGSVHWGRPLSKSTVRSANYYITRYPDENATTEAPTTEPEPPVEPDTWTFDTLEVSPGEFFDVPLYCHYATDYIRWDVSYDPAVFTLRRIVPSVHDEAISISATDRLLMTGTIPGGDSSYGRYRFCVNSGIRKGYYQIVINCIYDEEGTCREILNQPIIVIQQTTPTTEAPTTDEPTTEEPTTEEPTTEEPTTEVTTTEVPTTEVPTTEEPTTEEPTTEVPTTEVPTTEVPTTEEPTTEVPTTEEPTTEEPTTEEPTTEVPTTEHVRIPGDANLDGVTDMKDALLILRYIRDPDTEIDLSCADVNGDGSIDILDALLILQYDCGWDVVLK